MNTDSPQSSQILMGMQSSSSRNAAVQAKEMRNKFCAAVNLLNS